MAEIITKERETPSNGKKNKTKMGLAVIACLTLALLAAGFWWLLRPSRVSTDNAYVMADSALVSSRVAGSISQTMVSNDDRVIAGDEIVRLDPRDYESEVTRYRSALARIEAEIRVEEITVGLTETQTAAQVQAAEAAVQAAEDKERELRHHLAEFQQNRIAAGADLNHAQRDNERYSNLLKAGAGSEQQRDRSNTALEKAKAQYQASDAQIAAAKASLAAAEQEIDRAKAHRDGAKANLLQVEIERGKLAALKAKYSETQAQLQMAELNLSYCTIRAPISGYVAQKRIQVGERVQPGQLILAVVPLREVFVEANFKENQLREIRMGQAVEMVADIYPGHTYRGKVAGIRAGTGAAFSLLPPENATGNWIKVVQRIPVKIILDEPPSSDFPLRVGASLEVTVFTSDKSGPMLRVARNETDPKKAAP